MRIQAGYELIFSAPVATPLVAMLNLRPSRTADLLTPQRLEVDRASSREDYLDAFGNHCTRLTLLPGQTVIRSDFCIEDDGVPDRQCQDAEQHDIDKLPTEILTYLLGSRYCDTDQLADIAWERFGNTSPGWSRVQAVVDFVHAHLTYGYQHARPTRTAWEAYQERVGVCRDFAHLAVALCRCLNIPGRYCSGYLGDIGVDPLDCPMDFHAWFEVYLGGAWHSFDARHNKPRIGRILMACGRDAADTALTTAFGSVELLSFKVHTDEIIEAGTRNNAGLRLVA